MSTTLVILHCIHCLSFLLWLGLLVGNFSSYVELAGLLSRRTFAALGAFLRFDERRASTLPNLVGENGPFPVWSSWLWLDFLCGGCRPTSYAACALDTRGRQYYAWRRYWGRRRRRIVGCSPVAFSRITRGVALAAVKRRCSRHPVPFQGMPLSIGGSVVAETDSSRIPHSRTNVILHCGNVSGFCRYP